MTMFSIQIFSGMTDSICCSVDIPAANCASSGANDYIEIEGAREPPIMGFGVDRVGDGNRFLYHKVYRLSLRWLRVRKRFRLLVG